MQRSKENGSRERGSAMVEFVLVVGLFWVPLFMGLWAVGFSLITAIQVNQVCRDAGHMYSYGVDFSQSTYQNLLLDLASGLNMTATGGNGVVILSTITYVDSAACTAAGYSANLASCPNLGSAVFTRRIIVGNAALHASAFGTPNSADMDSSGNITSQGYLTHTADRATNFSPGVLSLTSSSEYAYVSEMWVQSPIYSGSVAAARSIF